MLIELKEKLFDILHNTLNYNVEDTAYGVGDDIVYPFVLLETSKSSKDNFNNSFKYLYSFNIHVFSNYNGEKEVVNIETEIYNALNALYELDGVIYFRERSFRIIDDKSTQTIKKHGIITIDIISAGKVAE